MEVRVTEHVRKVAGWLPISAELLADLQPRPLTPEERQRRAEREAAEHVLLQQRMVRHRELLAEGGTLGRLAELHGPRWSALRTLECRGCEYSGYEGEPPSWPCTTWAVLAGEEG